MVKIYSFRRLNSYVIQYYLRQIEDEKKAEKKAARVIVGLYTSIFAIMCASVYFTNILIQSRPLSDSEVRAEIRDPETNLHDLISEVGCTTKGAELPKNSKLWLKELTIDDTVQKCTYEIKGKSRHYDYYKIDLRMPKKLAQNYAKAHRKH